MYKKGENRPKDLAQVQQEIIISAGEDLEKLLSLAQKKLPALKWQNNKQFNPRGIINSSGGRQNSLYHCK